MAAVGDEGVDADHILRGHPGLGQNGGEVGKTEIGLRARAIGDGIIGGDAKLAGGYNKARARRHLYPVGVAGEGRADRGWDNGFMGSLSWRCRRIAAVRGGVSRDFRQMPSFSSQMSCPTPDSSAILHIHVPSRSIPPRPAARGA